MVSGKPPDPSDTDSQEVPMDLVLDNPLLKGVLAGTLAAKAIASTTAFAPVGVVGATGWTVVYLVAASTTVLEMVRMWSAGPQPPHRRAARRSARASE
jgi:hypothetical protein